MPIEFWHSIGLANKDDPLFALFPVYSEGSDYLYSVDYFYLFERGIHVSQDRTCAVEFRFRSSHRIFHV